MSSTILLNEIRGKNIKQINHQTLQNVICWTNFDPSILELPQNMSKFTSASFSSQLKTEGFFQDSRIAQICNWNSEGY